MTILLGLSTAYVGIEGETEAARRSPITQVLFALSVIALAVILYASYRGPGQEVLGGENRIGWYIFWIVSSIGGGTLLRALVMGILR